MPLDSILVSVSVVTMFAVFAGHVVGGFAGVSRLQLPRNAGQLGPALP